MSNAQPADKLVMLSMTGRQLRDLFAPVLPHLPTGHRPEPALNHIAIEVRDNALFLMATDRYTLGVHRLHLERPAADFTITLSAVAVRNLLRMVAARHQVAFGLAPARLTVLHYCDPDAAATEYVLRSTGAIIMRWRTLLGPYLDRTPDATVALLDPRALARFHAATGTSDRPLHIRSHHDMTVVTCGDHFIGAIKPKRWTAHKHTSTDLNTWRTRLTQTDAFPDAA
ncbi:hypothetical protein ACSNOI_29965 [Actinomadura kijaniata]|uniref:hypothetical protein n=1 Tax=Actinomadura kijaniata TaxID=46161 RepID=UPI003F1E1AEF